MFGVHAHIGTHPLTGRPHITVATTTPLETRHRRQDDRTHDPHAPPCCCSPASPPSTRSAPTTPSPHSPGTSSASSPNTPARSATAASSPSTPSIGIDEIDHVDLLIVPGGITAVTMARNGHPLIDWIRRVHPTTTWTTSVCTGALMLGAAGVLDGLAATTHWFCHDELAAYGAIPTDQRVVRDGKVVTAAGVSAGIDMALMLTETHRRHRLRPSRPTRHGIRPPTATRRRPPPLGAGRRSPTRLRDDVPGDARPDMTTPI